MIASLAFDALYRSGRGRRRRHSLTLPTGPTALELWLRRMLLRTLRFWLRVVLVTAAVVAVVTAAVAVLAGASLMALVRRGRQGRPQVPALSPASA